MSHRRNRTKQTSSFTERLIKAATDARNKAESLQPGKAKEDLLAKAQELESTVEMNSFLQK